MDNKTIETPAPNTLVSENAQQEKPWYKNGWLIYSIISAVAYSIFIFVGLDYTKSKTLTTILIIFEVVYILALIGLVVLSKDKSKLGYRIKNYKTAVKILKSISTVICLIMSIGVLINGARSFSFDNFFSVLYMILLILFSFVSLVISVLSIIFRSKIEEGKLKIKEIIKENINDIRK